MSSIKRITISALDMLVYFFLFMFLVAFILPINPDMPSHGLDP